MALYRKYRPATFAEVVGQEHVTDPLSTALDTGRISHAYLFSGPRGCGKTSSARILARSLNCVQGPTSKPCGVCPSCVALGPGGSGNLDVIELDAASHGGVDDTRELRDRAFYAPAESRYRVFIVDEAHMVTTAGFNALLKIVEEPPAHLIFVFATTEPDKVLPTIRSRTHHYPFRLLPPATMRGLLGKICDQEHVPVEESVYPLVIRAGGGSPRDSLSVLDQLLAGAGPEGVTYPRAVSLLGVTDVALIDDAVEALAASDGATLFGTIDRVVEAGHDPRRFATDLLERLRDLILLRAVPDAAARNLVTGPGDVLDRMHDQAERLGPAALARYAELLHEGLGDMRGATNPRLLLEVIGARMLLPAASDSETATLQRLEQLERRMAGGALPAAAPSAPAARPADDGSVQSAPRPAQSEGGSPRRRGAEALAALRAEKTGTPPTAAPQQQSAAPVQAAPQQQPPQQTASVQQPVAPQSAAAPVDTQSAAQPAAVRPPEMSGVRTENIAAHPAERAAAQQPSASGPVPATGEVPAEAERHIGQDAAPAHADSAAGQPAAPAGAADAAARQAHAVSGESTAGLDAEPANSAAAQEPSDAPLATDAKQVPEEGDEPLPMAFSAQSSAPAGNPAQASPAVAAADPDFENVVPQANPSSAADIPVTEEDRSGDSGEIGAPPVQASPLAAEPAVAHDVSFAGQNVVAAPEVGVAPAAEDGLSGAAGSVSADLSAPVQDVADSGVAGVPLGDEALREIEAAWADIRAKVREFGATVQAMLSGASVARMEGETIVLAHPAAPLAQRLSQPKNVEAVRSAVRAVLGRDHDVRWEVAGAVQAAPAKTAGGRGGGAGRGPGRESGGGKEPVRFTRPSQAAGKSPAESGGGDSGATGWGTGGAGGTGGGWGAPAGGSGGSAGAAGPSGDSAVAMRNAPVEDDIPLPDGPDLPDDPGPVDYSPVGYDGVPPASTEEEEREMLAQAAEPVAPGDRRDPDEVALELLKQELGATPLEG
ncbi:DNA polymerase III subunit gamma and tau [Nocardia huaxiensis]|uniref:DNA polymerase III subunit gamma and tau n=1 Tax=Nocardia huaxiensis TaxID=2755382 RepID=UPI001FD1D165|nr:DNA polymerase III subunit gamma and tau [Nocardia huaxiensis]